MPEPRNARKPNTLYYGRTLNFGNLKRTEERRRSNANSVDSPPYFP